MYIDWTDFKVDSVFYYNKTNTNSVLNNIRPKIPIIYDNSRYHIPLIIDTSLKTGQK